MRLPSKIRAEGKIALPLIVLAAFCCCDQLLNAVDYIRPSWLVCQALSFPVGWIVAILAKDLVGAARQDNGVVLFLLTAACAGTVLNIYLLAYAVTYLYRKLHKHEHV